MKHPAVEILEDLIAIQSVNPFYGGEGEKNLSDYLEQRCRQTIFHITRQPVFPGRDNLIIELRVGKPESTLLFEAHMDTASIGTMVDPLVPIYRDGRLYGRGSCDTKGTLAGMLYAMERAAAKPEQLSNDLVLCAAVDEEHMFRGILAFLDLDMPVAGAVVGEPTELNIVIAHKGIARFAVQTHGKAAHSSVPHEGNSAIYQMVEVLRFIRDEIEPGLTAMNHPLCGAPSIVAGTIRGGTQINIVPESCEIEIDRRVIPGEDARQVLDDFENRLRKAMENRGVNASVHELLLDSPLDTSPDAAIVRCAGQAASRLGLNGNAIGVPYGSDASKLQKLKGVPTIVYGPGSIAQAHSKEEYVPIVEVEQAAEFYLELANTFGQYSGLSGSV